MEIIDLALQSKTIREAAATLLVDHFGEPRPWPNLPMARRELAEVIADGFVRAMLDGRKLLGWIGGLPGYDGHVWELHPLVVHRDHRLRGIGRTLVAAFEAAALKRGALTVTLGTDDLSNMTSLSGVDLYANLPRRIAALRDLGRGHPFLFYRKLGYTVTGVLPDANGLGHPDIYMSKRVAQAVSLQGRESSRPFR